MDKDIAKKILGVALECSGRIDDSVAVAMRSSAAEELVVYRRQAGMVMASIFENVMAPIYDMYEDLAPEWYRQMNDDMLSRNK